ncbi:MAG: hypothetical protein EBU08_06840 [Micrococcales bacterium]|nr:hypothetical protein [Micrococcales bacterium]
MASFDGINQIEQALAKAFENWTEQDINDAFWDDQFKEDKWDHSPSTTRRNGDTVGSPRDIYDLGALYESGKQSYKLTNSAGNLTARWHWDAKNNSGKEYAEYVHEGTGTNAGYPRKFTDDLSIAFSFRKPVAKAFVLRVQAELNALNAN